MKLIDRIIIKIISVLAKLWENKVTKKDFESDTQVVDTQNVVSFQDENSIFSLAEKSKKINISVVTVIYNEEKRIENFIRSFLWSNDLIIIDKTSTDNTKSLVKQYLSESVKLITIPYTEHTSEDAKNIIRTKVKNEWIMIITASDLIDPSLVLTIKNIIPTLDDTYGGILVPYKQYAFGICDEHSYWSGDYKRILFKKNKLLLSDRVHEELSCQGDNYIIQNYHNGYFYHITHSTLTTFYERHIRYSFLETEKYFEPGLSKKTTFRLLIDSITCVLFEKKTYKLGWDGIALSLAYISYYLMTYLAVWQKFKGKGSKVYEEIKREILQKWKDEYYDKQQE